MIQTRRLQHFDPAFEGQIHQYSRGELRRLTVKCFHNVGRALIKQAACECSGVKLGIYRAPWDAIK